MSALLLVLVEPKKEEERKNSKSLSQRSVTSGTRIHARARRGVTRRAHTHRHHHHPHHRRARDDAMRVRYNNSHGERERREREREGNPKMEMIIGYGRTILSLLSLSFSLGSFLPAQNQKNKFSSSPATLYHTKSFGEKVSRTCCCCCSSSSGRRGLSHPRRTRSFSRAWQRQTYFNSSES